MNPGLPKARSLNTSPRFLPRGQLDLVVTVGGPAARFALNYRPRLFPATPMVFAALDQRHLRGATLGTNDAVVGISVDPAQILENILHVLPITTNVAVVLGSSPLEKFWLGEMHHQLEPFTNRVTFNWLTELSFAELQKRAATLPPRSAIFYAFFTADAAGVPYVEESALRRLHEVANAPAFGVFDTQLGHGIVGGRLICVEESSRKAAQAAVSILQGQPPGERQDADPGSQPANVRLARTAALAHQRNSIAGGKRGSLSSPWIMGGTSLAHRRRYCGLPGANDVDHPAPHDRARRRQAEAAARESARRLVNAQEDERTRLARELHDDITQRLALLAIDAGHSEGTGLGPGRQR